MRKRLGYLNISDSKTEYRINIYSKFTIITGFSGVGKTHLINTIAEAFRVYARSKDMFYQFYKFESNFIVNVLDESVIARFASSTQNWLEFLSSEFKRGSLLCIDEDFEDLYTFDFQNALMNFDGYFIICCRNNLKFIPYSVYDIYKLELSNNGAYHFNSSIPDMSYIVK